MLSLAERLGPPPKPENTLDSIPDKCQLQSKKLQVAEEFDVPTLTELMGKDFEKKLEILENFPYPGGETVALERMSKYISHEVSKKNYQMVTKTRIKIVFNIYLEWFLGSRVWKTQYLTKQHRPEHHCLESLFKVRMSILPRLLLGTSGNPQKG